MDIVTRSQRPPMNLMSYIVNPLVEAKAMFHLPIIPVDELPLFFVTLSEAF